MAMTEEELLKEKEKTEGARVSYEFMKKYRHEYDASESSAKLIGDRLQELGLEFNFANLEKVFLDLKAKGVRFMSAAPAPAVAATPAEDALPEIPSWFPKMENKADIRAIPRDKFKELYFGKAGDKFKARIEAVNKRGL
jgi:hypothetical protein